MNHTITIGGLLASIGMVAGALIAAMGLISLMAAGMSDAPSDNAGKGGCITFIAGLALAAASLAALLR